MQARRADHKHELRIFIFDFCDWPKFHKSSAWNVLHVPTFPPAHANRTGSAFSAKNQNGKTITLEAITSNGSEEIELEEQESADELSDEEIIVANSFAPLTDATLPVLPPKKRARPKAAPVLLIISYSDLYREGNCRRAIRRESKGSKMNFWRLHYSLTRYFNPWHI